MILVEVDRDVIRRLKAELAEARAQLEEAAVIAETHSWCPCGGHIAEKIRALSTKTTTGE